jgi:hypothetical protein
MTHLIKLPLEKGVAYVNYNPATNEYYVGKKDNRLGACMFTKKQAAAIIRDQLTGRGASMEPVGRVRRVQALDEKEWQAAHRKR